MQELFYRFFWIYIKYVKGFKSKWRKGELRIVRFDGVKVAILNDLVNRRVLVWFYIEDDRKIMRVAYHGYFYKHLARKIAHTVKLINTDDNFRENELFKRGSYSYKAEYNGRFFRK